MNPNSPASGRLDAVIGTAVEVVGDGSIIELDGSYCHNLFYGDEVLDIEQIMLGADPKSSDLHIIGMQKQTEFQPGHRRKGQDPTGDIRPVLE